MTVTDDMYQVEYMPPSVTCVKKEAIKSFSHSKRVGGYLLGRTLGVGSFAKVKEGLHLTTGEKVAVKVIDKKRAKSDNYVRKNLRREARLLQMVRHPNVVTLFEVMETDNSYYLVTELCRGGDLMDYITAKKRLPESEVIKFIRQIVLSVDYLHRMGIIHRDLKIENLLLDGNKDIKLIDFGLSNSIKVATVGDGLPRAQEFCVTQCGSPAYAAPELLNHEKYGLQVDLWSIGVNMYAMLTGSLPFTVEPFNIKSLYTKMKERQMNPVPDNLTKECRNILRKFLEPDPARRLTISEALAHPWLAQGNKPTPRSPCPNKLRTADLEADILSHMVENLGFRMGEIIKFVTCNTPSPACAAYHLFLTKLKRHTSDMRAHGEVPAMHTGRLRDGKVTLHLQEMRHKFYHQAVSHRTSQPTSPTPKSRGHSSVILDSPSQAANKKKISDGVIAQNDVMSSEMNSQHMSTPRAGSNMGHNASAFPLRNAPRRQMTEPFTKGNTSIDVNSIKFQEHSELTSDLVKKPLTNRLTYLHKGITPFSTEDTVIAGGGDTSRSDNVTPVAVTVKNYPLASSQDKSNKGDVRTTVGKLLHPNPHRQLIRRDSKPQDTLRVDHVADGQKSHDASQSSNKLFTDRGLGKSLDTSIMPTTGLKTVYRRKTKDSSAGQNTLTNKPVVSRIMPKQYVPFRRGQERVPRWGQDRVMRPSLNSTTSQVQSTEGLALQGKTLLKAGSNSKEETITASMPQRHVVINRKLVKRHRIGDITPPGSYVIQDVDQSVTTELLNLENSVDRGTTTLPLPSISPIHTQR